MRLIETGSFPLVDIIVGERLRLVDEDWAKGLACSIEDTGLQNPVQLLKIGNTLRLAAGAHRLRAFQLLERLDIPAKIHEPETGEPELELRLVEIEENLTRRELTALDRAASIAERKRILHLLKGETRGRKKKEVKFTLFSINEDLAAKIGVSAETVKKAAHLFNGLTPETRKRVAGTWLADHQAQLTAIVKACSKPDILDTENVAELQTAILDLMLCEPPLADTVKEALSIIRKTPLAEPGTSDGWALKLEKLWWNADGKARKAFLHQLQTYGVIVTPEKVSTGKSKRAKDA